MKLTDQCDRPHLALVEARQAKVKAQDELGAGSGVDTGPKDEAGTEGESEVSETPQAGSNSNAQLKSIVERVETIEAEIKEYQSDRADVYKEAAGNGYDVPALKAIVRARRETAEQKAKRTETEAHVDLYRGALGIS